MFIRMSMSTNIMNITTTTLSAAPVGAGMSIITSMERGAVA